MFTTKRTKKVTAFHVKVVYKSGATMEFDTLAFKISGARTPGRQLAA